MKISGLGPVFFTETSKWHNENLQKKNCTKYFYKILFYYATVFKKWIVVLNPSNHQIYMILNNMFNDQTTCYLISIFVFLQKGFNTSMPPRTFDWVHFLHHICVKKRKCLQLEMITFTVNPWSSQPKWLLKHFYRVKTTRFWVICY